jgi:hypothetical protein
MRSTSSRDSLAFTPVCDERHRNARLIARDHDVGKAVRWGPEVGMEPSNRRPVRGGAPADEVDKRSRACINQRGRDLRVLPIAGRKDLATNERLIEDRWRGCLQDDDGAGKRHGGHRCTYEHLKALITYRAVSAAAAAR